MSSSTIVRILGSLTEVVPDQWNALNRSGNPFTSYEFLFALERTGCVGGATGWHPEHVTLWRNNELIAATPAYRKDHSFGEFVFDWAWADAYRRAGLAYYPKLLVAIPFSPVTGERLLSRDGLDHSSLKTDLLAAIVEHSRARGYSTAHILFPCTTDRDALAEQNWLERTGFQFHWSNNGYRSFDDYLRALSARKRKNILRERRQVTEAGIELKVVSGADMTASRWDDFFRLYRMTAELKGGTAYLTRAFFEHISQHMPERILVVEATLDSKLIGCAYLVRGSDTLYGRSWGSTGFFPGLHFETCYYTPLTLCIEQGIKYFDAGAQGGHKLARGFLPTATYSYHWIAHREFRPALQRYLAEETRHVEDYVDELEAAGPFRKSNAADSP